MTDEVDRKVIELMQRPEYDAAMQTLKGCIKPEHSVTFSGGVATLVLLAIDHGMKVERERKKP